MGLLPHFPGGTQVRRGQGPTSGFTEARAQRTDGPIPNVTAAIEVTPPITTPLLSPFHTSVTLPMATAVGHFYHLCDGNNKRKLRGPNLALKAPGYSLGP